MKKILFALPLVALVMVWSTFADNSWTTLWTGTESSTGTIATGTKISPEAKAQIHQNWQTAKAEKKVAKGTFHVENGYLNFYFAPVTDKTAAQERRTTVKAAQDTLNNSKVQLKNDIKAWVKNKQPLSQETIYSRIDTMVDIWSSSVVKYVDSTKTDSYNTFIASKKALFKSIYGIHKTTVEKNKTIRQNDKKAI